MPQPRARATHHPDAAPTRQALLRLQSVLLRTSEQLDQLIERAPDGADPGPTDGTTAASARTARAAAPRARR